MIYGFIRNLPSVHCRFGGHRGFIAVMRRVPTIWFVLAATSFCWAQTTTEVRVRVLDYRTGHPAEGRTIGLLDSVPRRHWLIARTGRDGVATFHLSSSLPQTLTIDPEVTLSYWSCSRQQEFGTSEVLQHGVVGDFEDHPLCKDHTSSVGVALAGEIVVYARRLNEWLRFRRFLHEAING
jgi:hypothetical protein